MLNIALNGLGRIGKTILRTMCWDWYFDEDICIKAINIGDAEPDAVIYSLKYDSIMECPVAFNGIFIKDNILHIPKLETQIKIIADKDLPKDIWKKLEVDWVIDASGHYTTRERAQIHLNEGASGVIITAPAHDDDITIIMGVNDQLFDRSQHRIVSLGSCTTNALVPVVHILEQNTKISSLHMTTVHAYTNTQSLLDSIPKSSDVRRSRAAALNIVPSGTGAVDVMKRLYPHIPTTGLSLRVPVPVVSFLDLTVMLHNTPSYATVIKWFDDAAKGNLHYYLDVNYEPLVSSDFVGNSHSTIVDIPLCSMLENTAKIMCWYDNEYAYSKRVWDFIERKLVSSS